MSAMPRAAVRATSAVRARAVWSSQQDHGGSRRVRGAARQPGQQRRNHQRTARHRGRGWRSTGDRDGGATHMCCSTRCGDRGRPASRRAARAARLPNASSSAKPATTESSKANSAAPNNSTDASPTRDRSPRPATNHAAMVCGSISKGIVAAISQPLSRPWPLAKITRMHRSESSSNEATRRLCERFPTRAALVGRTAEASAVGKVPNCRVQTPPTRRRYRVRRYVVE